MFERELAKMRTYKHSESWPMKIFAFSVICIVSIFAADCKFSVLPLNGIYLFFYVIAVVSLSIWLTSKAIHRLLKETKPIDYQRLKEGDFYQRVKIIYNYLFKKKDNVNDVTKELSINVGGRSEGKEGNLSCCVEDQVDVQVFQQPTVLLVREGSIDERITDFVKDIEARFLNNWYSQISNEQSFLEESEKLLEEVVRRFLQVLVQIDHKKLAHSIFNVFLKHIKEFKKTVKRSEKSGLSIEECFRYSHVASKSDEAFQHYVYQLTTKVLRQFVSSELWNSLLWRTLVSILSKKLTTNILYYVAQPGFINYKIVYNTSSELIKKELNLDKKAYISLSDVNLSLSKSTATRHLLSPKIDNIDQPSVGTPKLTPKHFIEASNKNDNDTNKESGNSNNKCEDTVDSAVVKTSSTTTRTVSEPVKIYESSSHKTWRNSSDLESISLGEDLLAFENLNDPDSQIQNLIEKKLWKDNTDVSEVPEEKEKHSIWNIPENWFGEEPSEAIEGREPSPNIHSAAQIITNTMKPIGNVTAHTIQNMKDLQQSTVNTVNSVVKPISQATTSAKHKIGDLQDEAAGVMEGILDFGIAGLRKGLRLTGLQENINDLTQKSKHEIHKIQKSLDAKATDVLKNIESTSSTRHESPKPHKPPKLTKLSHITSDDINKLEERTSSNESDENIWLNPLDNRESPTFDGHILLEKTPITPKSFMQDITRRLSKEFQKNPDIPQIAMEVDSSHTSPILEYEDATDLATTTAKLRSLLQQRSSESSINTPALSPMPQDEHIKIVTPLEPAELTDVDGVMPSLYKFYNKTATGLQNTFNTIKTALPGTEKTPETPLVASESSEDWTYSFIEPNGLDFKSKMEKLLHERRDYCTVDPAYDYLEIMDQADGVFTKNENPFEDELDEFDVQVPITKAAFDILCELISDTNSPLTQEPVVRSMLLLIGNKSEETLTNLSDKMVKNIKNLIGKLPQTQTEAPLPMKLEKIIDILMEKLPKIMKEIVGKETIEFGLELLIKSLQSQKINLDLTLQIFDIISMQLIQANNLMSPAYSA